MTVNYGGVKIQTVELPFPSATLPAPRGDDIVDAEPFLVDAKNNSVDTTGAVVKIPILASGVDRQDGNGASGSNGKNSFPKGNVQSYGQLGKWYWSQDLGSFDPNAARTIPARINGSTVPPGFSNANATDTRTLADARDFQRRINYVLNAPTVGSDSNSPATGADTGPVTAWRGDKWRQLLQPGDTVRSLVFCEPPTVAASGSFPTGTTTSGDMRLVAVSGSVVAPTGGGQPGFYPHPDYGDKNPSIYQQACLLREGDGNLYYDYLHDRYFRDAAPGGFGDVYSTANPYGNHVWLSGAQFPSNIAVASFPRKLTAGVGNVWTNGVVRQDGARGDFDTGVGGYSDGPYFNKQDEGNAVFSTKDPQTGVISYPLPYFGDGSYLKPGNAFNSPNRQMPSPVMMGSLLSRVTTGHGWETLCFCPNPAGANHFGNTTLPKDHLLLDLFQMPVVEPYPISEPFSTAGRVNLNFGIEPFDYIERSTAVRAVLGSERVAMLGTTAKASYDPPAAPSSLPMYQGYKSSSQMTNNPRKLVDHKNTMALINEWLTNNGGAFQSASQICEVFLATSDINATTASVAQKLWAANGDLTGDNVREKPYANLYPRLTTRSNTYTIHMRVQALKQLGSSNNYGTWDESKDAVLGEYRGSSSIERYIDPSDRHFNPNDPLTTTNNDFFSPDATTPDKSLEALYRFRTVNTKLFAPY